MVRPCREKETGIRSNENKKDGNDWTQKEMKTKTEVERCYTKTYEGDMSMERSIRPKTPMIT